MTINFILCYSDFDIHVAYTDMNLDDTNNKLHYACILLFSFCYISCNIPI